MCFGGLLFCEQYVSGASNRSATSHQAPSPDASIVTSLETRGTFFHPNSVPSHSPHHLSPITLHLRNYPLSFLLFDPPSQKTSTVLYLRFRPSILDTLVGGARLVQHFRWLCFWSKESFPGRALPLPLPTCQASI